MSQREGTCRTAQKRPLSVTLRGDAAFNTALCPTPRPPCPFLIPTILRVFAIVRRVRHMPRERLLPQFRSDAVAPESRVCAFIECAAARACKCNARCQVLEIMQPSQLLRPCPAPPPLTYLPPLIASDCVFIVRTLENKMQCGINNCIGKHSAPVCRLNLPPPQASDPFSIIRRPHLTIVTGVFSHTMNDATHRTKLEAHAFITRQLVNKLPAPTWPGATPHAPPPSNTTSNSPPFPAVTTQGDRASPWRMRHLKQP